MLATCSSVEQSSVPTRSRPSLHQIAEHLAASALVLWWAGPMTARTGGRGPGATAIAVALVVLLFVLSTPWKRLGRPTVGLALAVPVAALAVCLTAPTGWYGADDLAAYTMASLAVPAIAAYARTSLRRSALVAAISLAGMAQFAQSFLPWWGGEDPSRPMTGTFYWWNPYAAFLLPGALLGIGLIVRGERPWRLVGWVAAPTCSAGIVFSSSRTTSVLLVIGTLALLLMCLERQAWRGLLFRWVLAVALCVGAVYAFAGPPFFEQRAGIGAAAEAKAERGETVAQNGAYRLEFWQRALAVFGDRPLVGSGSHAMVGASEPLVPAGLARSNLAHNGYLQALSDGGLVLGFPFLLGCATILVAATRRLLSARQATSERWLRIALPVALAGAAAHSFVDFDWSHSSNLLLTALLAALILAVPLSTGRPPRHLPGALILVPALLLAAVAGTASWRWDETKLDIGRANGTSAERAKWLRATGSGLFRDHRWAAGVLRLSAGGSGPLLDGGVQSAEVRWALAVTAGPAEVDPDLQIQRARALVVLGERAAAAVLVDRLLRQLSPAKAAGFADGAAQVLAATGRVDEGRRLVLRYLLASPRDVQVGAHLAALLDTHRGDYDLVDRCAYAVVPAELRAPHTADPGSPPRGTTCELVLQGALS